MEADQLTQTEAKRRFNVNDLRITKVETGMGKLSTAVDELTLKVDSSTRMLSSVRFWLSTAVVLGPSLAHIVGHLWP